MANKHLHHLINNKTAYEDYQNGYLKEIDLKLDIKMYKYKKEHNVDMVPLYIIF